MRPSAPLAATSSPITRVLVAGAAGRDFHTFNVLYRESDRNQVVAFRRRPDLVRRGPPLPVELAGPRDPQGVPILAEAELETIVREQRTDKVVLSSSTSATGTSRTWPRARSPPRPTFAVPSFSPASPAWACAPSARKRARARPPVGSRRDGAVRGGRLLCVENGPTLTHGEMSYGATALAARPHGAGELRDPLPYPVSSIRETFSRYPHIGPVLPATGYSPEQVAKLAETIARSPAEVALVGSPVDLRRLVPLDRPALRVRYRPRRWDAPASPDVLSQAGLAAR